MTESEVQYLDLADFCVIAADILGIAPKGAYRATKVNLAESALMAPAAEFGGVEFYPDFHAKAGILCSRIVRNHPLPDGNKRTGWICMLEFIDRNGHSWKPPAGDPDETVQKVEELAASTLSEEAFIDWVGAFLN